MKKMNMGFMLLVGVLIVAVVLFVYRYIYPVQPWLEGFQDVTPFMTRGEAVGSLIFLNKAYKAKDVSGGAVEADMLTVSSCPAKDTKITKTCYSDMLKKYGVDHERDVPESAANLSIEQVRMTLGVLRAYKGIFGSDISQYEMTTAIANDTICGKNKSSVDGFIKPICYNSLLKTLYKNIAAASTSASAETETSTLAPAQSTKDYRVSFFKNLSLIAGYTNLKSDAIETAYDKMKSCGKDDSEYDIDCFHELADEFNINITKEAMNSVGVSTKTKTTAEKTVEDALNLLKDTKATAADAKKCTVEFGKKPEIVPQTGAATETKPDTTCVTTGDVVKETKTPAVEQGCDFANKMPKINVINLRDYVHKDEIPCWSCKL
jgi:hypothetical protein